MDLGKAPSRFAFAIEYGIYKGIIIGSSFVTAEARRMSEVCSLRPFRNPMAESGNDLLACTVSTRYRKSVGEGINCLAFYTCDGTLQRLVGSAETSRRANWGVAEKDRCV